jgi:hypothetical protein
MHVRGLINLTIALPLLLIACGAGTPSVATATTVPPPAAPMPATITPPVTPVTGSAAAPSVPAATRTITEADNGMTVQVAVGAVIAIALRAPPGSDPWQVHSPDPQIVMPLASPAATAVTGMTAQAYRAVGAGQTAITAESRPHCDPGKACAQVIQGFRVTVVVTV